MFVSTGIFSSAITVVLYTEVNSSGMAIQKLLLVVYKCCFHRDILECNNCGIVYRSRQFWYGNPEVITGSIQMFVSTVIS